MAARQINILVIGGQHTDGFGLNPGQSFVEQFTRRLSGNGQRVKFHYHTPLDLNTLLPLLPYLHLDRYDLVLLQLGHIRLEHPIAFSSLLTNQDHRPKWSIRARTVAEFSMVDIAAVGSDVLTTLYAQKRSKPKGIGQWLLTGLKLLLLQTFGYGLGRLREIRHQLIDLLEQLRPYRHNLILLTPLPHCEPVSRWLRQRGRLIFLQEGEYRGFSVFDTHAIIQPREEYFVTGHTEQLSAVGHELLGSYLYEYYWARLNQSSTDPVPPNSI